jgi:hypothetical protein
MKVSVQGTPTRADEIQAGECFAFEAGNEIAVGLAISYAESAQVSILVLNRPNGQPPSLYSQREARPITV